MGNSNKNHSKALRQKTASARRAAIKAAGGKDLSGVLLEVGYVSKITALRDRLGLNQTDLIKFLIDEKYRVEICNINQTC